MGAPDEDTRRLAKVLEHPIRARIIELLGEKGPLGWKDLSGELGVRTGSLYYHLDTLEGLVDRDSAKRYFLTRSGQIVYAKTLDGHTLRAVKEAAAEINKEGLARRLASAVLVPRSLLSRLAGTEAAGVSTLVATFTLLIVLSLVGGVSPSLYFTRLGPDITLTAGGFGISFAAILGATYGTIRYVFKSVVDVIPLAAAISISFLPVYCASLVTLVPAVKSFLVASSPAYTLLQITFQAWSSAILAAGLSMSSGIRVERTLFVSLGVLYASAVLMILGL